MWFSTQCLNSVPPLDQQRHERHFGLVNANGTLKPHALVLRQFAATNPMRRPVSPHASY